jgi:hypothetical protein
MSGFIIFSRILKKGNGKEYGREYMKIGNI